MPVYTEEDYFKWLVEEYAPPAFPAYPAEEQLVHWQERLPGFLLRWWTEQGWGSLSNGQYWICDPDCLHPVLEEVFADDPQYNADDLIPFGYNALGMIDVFMGEGKTMTIDLVFGTVTWRDQSKEPDGGKTPDFKPIYFRIDDGAHRLEWKDEDGIQIFPWALEHLGPLESGEIYGFIPAYSASGDYPVKNLQKQPVIEHLVMLASLSPPTLYDYVQPADGQGGLGALVPRRKVGRQR